MYEQTFTMKLNKNITYNIYAYTLNVSNYSIIQQTYKSSYSDNKPGGPSNSTARGLLDSNLCRVPRAISSYTSGLRKANSTVSSITLEMFN